MLDIAEELNRWVEQGRDFAVATVVAVGGSAPRQPGAALAVDSEGTAIGSVSGGCVEGAVYELCQQALEDGETIQERFGYSDDDAFAVGLTCGGIIDILVTPVPVGSPVRKVFAAALAAAARGEAAAVARIAEGPAELRGRAVLVRGEDGHEGGFGGTPSWTAPSRKKPAPCSTPAGRACWRSAPTAGSAESRSRCSSSPASRRRG